MNHRLFDNARDIADLNAPVPDPLGIDHHRGSKLALVETSGLVSADERPEFMLFHLSLESTAKGFTPLRVTAATAAPRFTPIAADEDVTLKWGHGEFGQGNVSGISEYRSAIFEVAHFCSGNRKTSILPECRGA